MQIEATDFLLKIIILFFPGILAVMIEDRNTNVTEKSNILFIMRASIYGFVTYAIYMCLVKCVNHLLEYIAHDFWNGNPDDMQYIHVYFFDSLGKMNETKTNLFQKNIKEMFIVTPIAILLAWLKSYYENVLYENNYLNTKSEERLLAKLILVVNARLCQKKYIRRKISNADIWNYVFGNNMPILIVVRDWSNERAYIGYMGAASGNHNNAEFYLENVTIIDMSKDEEIEPVRKMPYIYLCKSDADDWDIEIYDKKN